MGIAGFISGVIFEPQLNARYSDYLAECLRSGFQVRQIGNTYKVTMMFISHGVPKNLLVDEVIRIGQGSLSAVGEQVNE